MDHGGDAWSPITSISKLFYWGGYPRIKSQNIGRLSHNLYN